MKLNRPSLVAVPLLGFLLATASLVAEDHAAHPFIHPLFSDHAVLQRQVRVPVWGWAQPGTKITVAFAGQSKVTTAGTDGKWLVRLDKMATRTEPSDLTVISGQQSVTIHDVLVGDVWLC